MTSSTAGWVSSSHVKEVERLTQLLWHYETANIEQKEQLDVMQSSREGLIIRIQQMEVEKKKLLKQIRNLELSVKFEKSASEGIRKKSGLLEKEVLDLSDSLQRSQLHESELGERKDTLEHELQQERAYRLQLVHEKEKLLEEVAALENKVSAFEQDNAAANQKLLSAQQRLETLEARNTRQEQLVSVQAQEISALNTEVIFLKEDNMKKARQVLAEQASQSDYHSTIDQMQEEISFLRKEMTQRAQGHTERSIASFQPQKSRRSNYVTNRVNNDTAKRFPESHFRDQGTFRTRNSQAASEEGLQDKSWISDQFPAANHRQQPLDQPSVLTSSTSTQSMFGAHQHSKPRTQRRSMSPPSLSPLATRDRPRNAIQGSAPRQSTSAPLNYDGQAEVEEYFNSPQRVAMMDWIRTSSRQASRQRVQAETEDANLSRAHQIHDHQPQQHPRAQTIQNIYAPSASAVTLNSSSFLSFGANRTAPGPESAQSLDSLSFGNLPASTALHSSSGVFSVPSSAQPSPGKSTTPYTSALTQILEISAAAHDRNIHKPSHTVQHPPEVRHKSLYVGSGLSLRKDDSLDAELRALQQQGSTKHILRKILGDAV